MDDLHARRVVKLANGARFYPIYRESFNRLTKTGARLNTRNTNTMTKNETLREIVAHRQDLHGLASDCPDISAAILSTRAALDIAQDMAETDNPTLPHAMLTIKRRIAVIKSQSHKIKQSPSRVANG
jgi:hypothetical protein